jgi:hypothetical protein
MTFSRGMQLPPVIDVECPGRVVVRATDGAVKLYPDLNDTNADYLRRLFG